MKAPRFLPLFITVASLSTGSAAESDQARQPNVVIIYGDDVGFADVGVNGGTMIPTPNIDRLASRGLNFTDGHSSAATCTPSRFSMLTGVHAFRHGVRILPPNGPLSIPTKLFTLPKLFQKAGYTTGIIGKWHLGLGEKGEGPDWNGELKPGPLEIGFDSAFLLPTTNDRVPCVYLDGHRVINLDPEDPIQVGKTLADVQRPGSTQYPDAKKNPKAFYNSIVSGIGRIGYMSGGKKALWNDHTMADLFVDKARDFIAGHKNQPFFLFFSSQDIHIPNAPHKRFKGSTKLGKRGDAMVQLDWSVGEILKALDEHGLSENTIVIFTSDNGPTTHNDSYGPGLEPAPKHLPMHDASGKWRGGKYRIYEGGTRVPFIVRWPAGIEPGSSNAVVNQIDFTASFASLLDIELGDDQAADSRDTMAAFLGQDQKGLPFLVEEAHGQAIRVGNWKYIPQRPAGAPEKAGPDADSLFNLEHDAGEENNVLSQHPEKADELKNLLQKIRKGPGTRAIR